MKKYLFYFSVGFAVGILISIYQFSFKCADLYWHASLPFPVLLKWLGNQTLSFLESGVLGGLMLAGAMSVRQAILYGSQTAYKRLFINIPFIILFVLVSWVQVNYLTPIAAREIYPIMLASKFGQPYTEAITNEYYSELELMSHKRPISLTTPELKQQIEILRQATNPPNEETDMENSEAFEELSNAEKKLAERVPGYYLIGYALLVMTGVALETFIERNRRKNGNGVPTRSRVLKRMRDKRFAIPACIAGIFVLLFYQRGVQHIVHVEQVPSPYPVILYGKPDEGRIYQIRFPFAIECRSLSLRKIRYKTNSYLSDYQKPWETGGTSAIETTIDSDTLKWLSSQYDAPERQIHIYPPQLYILQQGYSVRKDSTLQQGLAPYLSMMREAGKDTLHLTYEQMETITPGLTDHILRGDSLYIGFHYDGNSNGVDIPIKGV